MKYPYNCETCIKEVIIEKPMNESSREEKCEKCGNNLNRIYVTTAIRTQDGFKGEVRR